MKGWKPLIEVPAILAGVLLCAWVSNALAGPTRKLTWRVDSRMDAPSNLVPPPPAAPDWDPAALLARFPPLQGQPYAEITGDEARWLQLHGALILDARRTAVFAEGHLPGAKSLSVWEDGLAAKIAALKGDPTLPTVIYCAGGDCEDSHLLAQKLWLTGYRNLRVYTGGYPDWSEHRWPVTKGMTP